MITLHIEDVATATAFLDALNMQHIDFMQPQVYAFHSELEQFIVDATNAEELEKLCSDQVAVNITSGDITFLEACQLSEVGYDITPRLVQDLEQSTFDGDDVQELTKCVEVFKELLKNG